MTRGPLYPRSLLLVLLVLLNSSLISNTFDDSDFDNADTEDVKNTGCDKGHAPNKDDTCEVCYRGYYSDQNEKKCMLCPFNTYSDGAANEECSVCPYEKKTTEQGSISADQCVDICEIPARRNSYYEIATTNEVLEPSQRVVEGEQLILQCIDDEHHVLETKYSHLLVMCNKHVNLPNTCISDQAAGITCYDSCYKETSGGKTRFVKLADGGTVVVESCPIVECKSHEDTCVSVSYTDTFRDVERIHFSCQQSALTDNEICKHSGATEEETGNCKVQRCNTGRCNKPEVTKQRASSSMRVSATVSTLVLVVSCTFFSFIWR